MVNNSHLFIRFVLLFLAVPGVNDHIVIVSLYFLENQDLTEPFLMASAREDDLHLGADAHTTHLKHLKEIRKAAEEEFGQENILSETEAQDVMVGVSSPPLIPRSDPPQRALFVLLLRYTPRRLAVKLQLMYPILHFVLGLPYVSYGP